MVIQLLPLYFTNVESYSGTFGLAAVEEVYCVFSSCIDATLVASILESLFGWQSLGED